MSLQNILSIFFHDDFFQHLVIPYSAIHNIQNNLYFRSPYQNARMAEQVDALVSKTSSGN